MSDEDDLKAELERLRNENAALKKGAPDGIRTMANDRCRMHGGPSGSTKGQSECIQARSVFGRSYRAAATDFSRDPRRSRPKVGEINPNRFRADKPLA